MIDRWTDREAGAHDNKYISPIQSSQMKHMIPACGHINMYLTILLLLVFLVPSNFSQLQITQ